MKKAELNAKAMNLLYCALDPNEFNRISTCNSAKEIWDRLEVTHEGTNQVKESKINLLMHNYELFKMEPTETISEMFTRFTDIINGLKSLGRTYTNSDLVQKILRCLPDKWDAKATAIQEAKDLNTLPLEELLGSLMTYELNMKRRSEDESRKKKTIALQAATEKKAVEAESPSSSEEDIDDEDMALVVRKFRKFMGKGRFRYRKKYLAKGEPNKEKEKEKEKDKDHQPICYECKKPGHYRSDCPLLKKFYKKGKKKKAMLATWSDSDESSSSEEEKQDKEANLCLMGLEDEVCNDSTTEFTYDELHTAFYDLLAEYKKAGSKLKVLKNNNDALHKENNEALKKNEILQREFNDLLHTKNDIENEKNSCLEENHLLCSKNKILQIEVDRLKPLVDKLTLSSNKLELILKNQRDVGNKTGIGYNSHLKKKPVLNATTINSFQKPKVICFHCKKSGHKSFACNQSLKKKHKVKKIWVPKGTMIPNPKGPKKTWVPKSIT